MASEQWENTLHCPYCGSGLTRTSTIEDDSNNEFSILQCECHEYPVVAGIPILVQGQIGARGVTGDAVVSAIRQDRTREALLMVLRPQIPLVRSESRWSRSRITHFVIKRLRTHRMNHLSARWQTEIGKLLFGKATTPSAQQLFEMTFGPLGQNSQNFFNYYMYRFGVPRHLTALSLATTLEPSLGMVLDVGCGPGHVTRYLCHRYGAENVVGVDKHFLSLYVAKNIIAPGASYICCDAETGLPFPTDSFGSLNCVNAFHFMNQKVICAKEMQRVTRNDGVFLLSALRHSLFKASFSNAALPPEGYARLWGRSPHLMVPDSRILERYLDRSGADLTEKISAEIIERSPLISMVISQNKDCFEKARDFEVWPHSVGQLGLNPLYSVSDETSETISFERKSPSRYYEEVNRGLDQYLPKDITLRKSDYSELRAGGRPPAVESLIDKCIVLDIPPSYRSNEDSQEIRPY